MKCLMCGCDKKEIISKICSNMKIMGTSFPNEDSHVVACKNCGNVYVDTKATQEDFLKYYSSTNSKSLSYFEVFGKDNTLQYYERIYDNIKEVINPESQILDFGGGLGDFSLFLKNKGYENIVLFDPSTICVKEASEKGIKAIKADSISYPSEYLEKFDLVIFSHVMEHIIEYDVAMETVKKFLKHNGCIYLEVPNADKYTEVNFAPYFFFTYEHVLHLTVDTLQQISNAFGLELLKFDEYLKCNSYYVLYGIYRKSKEKREVNHTVKAQIAVEKYISYCEKKMEPIIKPYEQSQEKLIFWGIGASTAQLLNHNFDNCNVIGLVDSNPSRQKISYKVGKRNLIIEDPSTINSEEATILILPVMYKDSIERQIRKMGLKNKVEVLSKK